MTEQKANELFEKWRKILHLEAWDIRFKWKVRAWDTNIADALGCTSYKYESHQAIIQMLDPVDFEQVLKNVRRFYPPTVNQKFDQAYNSKKLRQAIIRSLNNGAGVPQMAKDIQSVINVNESSAIMRARTVATGAQNKSRLDSLRYAEKKFGVKYAKVWDSSHDSRVRPSHQRLTGQRRGLEEKFSNGLMYPGESGGKWAEIANCRCKIKVVKVKDGR